MLVPAWATAAVFSGEVESSDAQPIFTPPSNSSPVVLRYFIADGSRVNKGDVVLRIDAGEAAAEIRSLEAQIEQARAKTDKEVAELRLKAVDADVALIDAQAALATAKIDAALPKRLLSALDFDRYQAEFERATHDALLKQQELDAARAAASRRADDGRLELEKLTTQRSYDQAQVDAAEVRAERDGTVIHAFGSFFGNGGRFEEGSSSYPGQKVGEIAGGGAMRVKGWALAPDRRDLKTGAKVALTFDALSGKVANGTIRTISGAPEARSEWGAGHYYDVGIDIENDAVLQLKPGMSVRIQTTSGTADKPLDAAWKPGDIVRANGEIYARSSAALLPPQVEDLWQMTITQMATDGQAVKKDEVVVTFDGGELSKKLMAKQSELQEKLRTQEKLHLELAERARNEVLATAESHADAIKAQRKASAPEAAVPGVDYKKLVVAKQKAERHEAASQERERAATDERSAEQRMADADATRLAADVDRMQKALVALQVKAPRDGVIVHATGWDNEKIDVGKQIWRGQSVAEIPDIQTLAVRASLAERDLTRVHVGDTVRIVLEGGTGLTLSGKIDDVGASVHSKSRVEPVPVVDLRITLDPTAITFKTGQPVRVEIVQNAQKGT
ncbi:MAG: HlyD family efflux transporter periplasmic adaptor subunit [Rudaea sp.]